MKPHSRSTSARTHRHTDFTVEPTARDESFLFELIKSPELPPFLLILDNIQDPHNLGACLRTADGAGVHAVIIPKDRSVHLTSTVRTVACGAAEHVPVVEVTNLARVMDQLKEAGIWLVGTSDKAAQSLYQIDLKGPLALVMGSEGKGLRRLTSEKCDFLVSLPMHGTVSSLNVSVATGICLYEAVRQRSGRST
ncbi:MAG: 23S rRNA (guanosine(2251)-2'-O)-methyltransferase RlmB [Candidatus Zixiibacteriota bacterium]